MSMFSLFNLKNGLEIIELIDSKGMLVITKTFRYTLLITGK
mgnify:CR=1 FL=1